MVRGMIITESANSMDAISFVLGIKSSHLRSSHLKDLVYRGRVLKTSKINDDGSAAAPTTNGHANGDGEGSDEETQSQRPGRNDPKSAWVMAVYEDDAGDEQKWKRTITNQGASEYRINDRVVTAAQYNEALESENILIKARNFLVFQGDVEAIASQSPKDLTRLIEQISGSLEYKAEYERLQEEAERAAENQTYNLHRRRGINSEIKQYQEQKKEAEAFQAKADQRDDAIVTHILWKLYHFQRVMEESTASIQEHQENLKEFRRGVEKYEKTLEEARQSQSRVSKEVAKVERSIKKAEKEVEGKENDLVPIDEKIDITNQEIEKLGRKVESLSKERDVKNAEYQGKKKQLSTVEKAQKQFESQWQETLKKQGKQLSEADFKEYNTLRSQVFAKTSNDQSKLDNLSLQKKTVEVSFNSVKSKVGTHQAAVEKLETEYSTINERKEKTELAVKDISKDIETKKKEFHHIQSERVRINQIHTEKEEKLQALLRTLVDADAGRRQNDKEKRTKETIVALKRLYPGVRGRVGDLCKPKQKKYDEAVITALGRDFDSVIVDTEKTGTECVQYLKDNRSSPMTFIPLDNIKVTAPDANLKSLPKARLTIDTIDFDSSLERAMAYACGSSIVCDDLATAKHICYERKIQVKAVTLEGFVIHKAGLMTGGRGPEKGNKRKFEDHDIDQLRNQAEKYREEIASLPKVNRKGSVEETLQVDLAGLERDLLYAKSELAAFKQNLASKKKELDFEKKQLKEMQPKFNEKQSELGSISEKVQEFETAIAKVQDKIFSEFCKRLGYSDIRAYEAQQGSLEQEAAEKRNAFEVQKLRLETLAGYDVDGIKEIETRIQRVQTTLKGLKLDVATYSKSKSALENAIDIDRAKITELEDELHKLKEKLAAKNEKVNQAKNELQKRSKEIDIRTKAITQLETDVQRTGAGRYALLRRCKLEQIAIPLTQQSRKLDTLPVDDNVLQTDPDAMDVDEGDEAPQELTKDYGIEVDFEDLGDELKQASERTLLSCLILTFSA
jgi:structural maintenance of chromosome 1